MSSGFSGGGSEFFNNGGIAPERSNTTMPLNNPQIQNRSTFTGVSPNPSAQIVHRRSDLIGKRSIAEFQQQHNQFIQFQLQQQQQLQQRQNQQQQQHNFGHYFRNVKPRTFQHAATSPISPISPMDFSTPSEVPTTNPRYNLPLLQQLCHPVPLPITINNNNNNNDANLYFTKLVQNHAATMANKANINQELDEDTVNKLQELEKKLLHDEDEEFQGDTNTVPAVTVCEWSEAIQSLITPSPNPNPNTKPISPSPTSSSSSSSSSSCPATLVSPPVPAPSPKQLITGAASEISERKPEIASEILTRLTQMSDVKGTAEQRLISYMASALRSRVLPTEYPAPVSELFSKEHTISTQMLYDVSPCFKLGFMAANLAILEATTLSNDDSIKKLHVIDFDIGQGGQYVHLLYALASSKAPHKPTILKISTFTDYVAKGSEERLKAVGNSLKTLANKVGLSLIFNLTSFKVYDKRVGLEKDEVLAVNFAFKLYNLPDESVSTENYRDDLLRRVKGLSPSVVTVVEQEMNGNTSSFVPRVNEACSYYGALFESLEATVPKESSQRVKIEEGLGRRMGNSLACEGKERVERCEVFGKWTARLRMAGFKDQPISSLVADSLRSKLSGGTRGNPGFTVQEQKGGICFGWMGRTLTVASAWC